MENQRSTRKESVTETQYRVLWTGVEEAAVAASSEEREKRGQGKKEQ